MQCSQFSSRLQRRIDPEPCAFLKHLMPSNASLAECVEHSPRSLLFPCAQVIAMEKSSQGGARDLARCNLASLLHERGDLEGAVKGYRALLRCASE